MLTVSSLSFAYKFPPKSVLSNVSFAVPSGITFLVGENGCGKTTLIKNLLGILQPQEGDIRLNGVRCGQEGYNRQLAYLPQVYDIYPKLKVSEILMFVARQRDITGGCEKDEVQRVAKQLNITAYLHKQFRHCSPGIRKRIGIASTLIGNCKVTVMDEPTAGVDPRERLRIYQLMRECYKDRCVLVSSHILDDLDNLADNIVMLSSSRVVYSGSYHDFRHSLDNKVWSVLLDDAEKKPCWLHEVNLLSATTKGRHIDYHFTCNNGKEYFGAEPALASMEDLWSYYACDHANN